MEKREEASAAPLTEGFRYLGLGERQAGDRKRGGGAEGRGDHGGAQGRSGPRDGAERCVGPPWDTHG